MQKERSYVYNSRHAIVAGLVFILLAIAYCYYMLLQNSDVFFESQFLHYEFLKELIDNKFTARGFFTVFGEHLFPGYNLILAVNYYLFDIWGGFDSIVYAVFLILTAGIIVLRIYTTTLTLTHKVSASSIIAFLLLSATNTPQWGMALAAAGGVFFFVLSALFVEEALWGSTKKINPLIFLTIPAAQIVFLGGYAIGSIAALGGLVLINAIQNRRVSKAAVIIALTVVASLGVYLFLTIFYSQLMANKPASIGLNLELIIKFAILMSGASVLGKAFYEQMHTLWPYYFLGSILIALTLCVWIEFIRRPSKGRMFILALSIYSAVNIATVAFFRYRNGLDGALGQWYNVHTHFISVAVIYWLFLKLRGLSWSKSAFSFLVVVIVFASAGVGYMSDWRKAPYSREYKDRFAAQALTILSFPELIPNKNDVLQTMLWDYESVKKTIDMMYVNKLWIFNMSAPIVSGLTHDNWLEPDKPLAVLCPEGARNLHLRVWRREDWAKSVVKLTVGGEVHELTLSSGDITIRLPAKVHAVMLDASDLMKSKPIASPPDDRLLVAKYIDAQCLDTP